MACLFAVFASQRAVAKSLAAQAQLFVSQGGGAPAEAPAPDDTGSDGESERDGDSSQWDMEDDAVCKDERHVGSSQSSYVLVAGQIGAARSAVKKRVPRPGESR